MHSLFLSTNHHSFHCQNFSFHLHTLSLSTGRRLHTLAPLRIRIPKLSSFGCFSAPLYSWHTDFDAHIIARNNAPFTTIWIPHPSSVGRVYTDCDAHLIARTNVSFTTIPFQSFLHNVPLNNTPSLAAVAEDECPQDVEDDAANIDCSVKTADSVAVVQTTNAAPLDDYDAAFARRTVRRTALNMDLSAPQAVDLTAPDGT